MARAITEMQLGTLRRQCTAVLQHVVTDPQGAHRYYEILERTQKGTLDITEWLRWFLGCMDCALGISEQTLSNVLRKARFWERVAAEDFNSRQRTMLNKLLNDFQGKLTSFQVGRYGEVLTRRGPTGYSGSARQEDSSKRQRGRKEHGLFGECLRSGRATKSE